MIVFKLKAPPLGGVLFLEKNMQGDMQKRALRV